MLAQFQAKYPGGSLVSELVTIYEGQYVVKVSAQIDGKVLATALAAAETVETAEDRARDRVLAVCDVDLSACSQPSPPSSTPNHPQTKTTSTDAWAWQQESPSSPQAKPAHDTESSPPTLPKPESFRYQAFEQETNTQTEEDDTQPVPPSAGTEEEPMDLSDIIVQTDIEMRRLGWGKEQGRRYLEATYNKRSRQQLTLEELRSFLDYLRSQPTPQK
jgi:hypothetical protein